MSLLYMKGGDSNGHIDGDFFILGLYRLKKYV